MCILGSDVLTIMLSKNISGVKGNHIEDYLPS